jgi:hypothetical protein
MSGIVVRNFAGADERVTFDHGHVDLIKTSSLALGWEVLEPGWRWSVHVKPIAGTERCEFRHVSIVLEGRVGVETRDGELAEAGPGDVLDIAPGHDSWVVGDAPAVVIDVQGVLGWAKAPETGDRVLTTLLFTDIVGSTEMAERLGDRAWKQLLASHDEAVRGLLDMYRGREAGTTGDGFVATFDAPARAILCALAISAASSGLGIEVRAGVHTGESDRWCYRSFALPGRSALRTTGRVGLRRATSRNPARSYMDFAPKNMKSGWLRSPLSTG